MNILFAAAESTPFVKAGGLGDVVGSLPQALARAGEHSARVIIPHHAMIDDAAYGIELFDTFDLPWDGTTARVRVSFTEDTGVPVYLIRGWPYFDSGETWVYHRTDEGMDVGRFLFFSAAALHFLRRLVGRNGWRPDIVHVHDWHTAMIPYLLRQQYHDDPVLGGMPTLFSIHNMKYQGWGIDWHLAHAGFPPVDAPLLRSTGRADNSLAIGLYYSTMLSTVSPTYATEITTLEGGYGLDGLVHARTLHLVGILNGLDTVRWNPATSTAIAATYDADTLDQKAKNKQALQAALGLPERSDVALIGAVTRLDEQKGIDIMIPALRHVLWYRDDVQFVLLGSGEVRFESSMRAIEADYPGKARARLTFDEKLAELIYAGADIFLMPSQFEPCGLGQMIAMQYGTLPVVRQVGGLADTVSPGTGFLFGPYDMWPLANTIDRAVELYHTSPADWRLMQQRAMAKDFRWEISAGQYADVYERAIRVHRAYA